MLGNLHPAVALLSAPVLSALPSHYKERGVALRDQKVHLPCLIPG